MDQPHRPLQHESSDFAPHKPAVIFHYTRRPLPLDFPEPKAVENAKPPVAVSAAPKKTRDLPNLSQCHACGFRVDLHEGKHRLQTMYSEWRVVLLCGKCLHRVESAAICSYCFADTSDECFRCSGCKRWIHRDCFITYKNVAPWSYTCSGSDLLSVCVDCWVPKPMANSNGGFKRMRSGGKNVHGVVACKLGRARVLESGDGAKPLEDLVNDANRAVKRKKEAAAKAKAKAVKKVAVARRAVELATGALDMVAIKEMSGIMKCGERGDDVNDAVVDDDNLAFQLHRSINSSPRISGNFCSVNTSCMDAPVMLKYTRKFPARTSGGNRGILGKLQVCANEKLCQNVDGRASELSAPARTSDCNNTIREVGEVIDTRSSGKPNEGVFKSNEHCENVELPLKEEEGNYLNHVISELQLCKQYESTKLEHRGSDAKVDRFLIKYRKRSLKSDTALDTKSPISHEGNRPLTSSTLLLPRCWNESRTCSGASLHSSVVPL